LPKIFQDKFLYLNK